MNLPYSLESGFYFLMGCETLNHESACHPYTVLLRKELHKEQMPKVLAKEVDVGPMYDMLYLSAYKLVVQLNIDTGSGSTLLRSGTKGHILYQ